MSGIVLSRTTITDLHAERRMLEVQLAKTEESIKAINSLISVYPLKPTESKKIRKPTGLPTKGKMICHVLGIVYPSSLTTVAIRTRVLEMYEVRLNNISELVRPYLKNKTVHRIRKGKYKHVPVKAVAVAAAIKTVNAMGVEEPT